MVKRTPSVRKLISFHNDLLALWGTEEHSSCGEVRLKDKEFLQEQQQKLYELKRDRDIVHCTNKITDHFLIRPNLNSTRASSVFQIVC